MYMNIIYTYIQYKIREIPKSPALGHIFLVPDSSQMKKGWKLDDLPSFSLVRKKSTAAEKLENPWPQSVSIIRRSSAGVFETKKKEQQLKESTWRCHTSLFSAACLQWSAMISMFESGATFGPVISESGYGKAPFWGRLSGLGHTVDPVQHLDDTLKGWRQA